MLKNFLLLYQALRYVRHYFAALNGRGHGIHSPFVFDFVKTVLNKKHPAQQFAKIEKLRRDLLKDHTMIRVTDLGAGSQVDNGSMRRVSAICRNTSKPAKIGRLLSAIAARYQPATLLELGTSLGISSAYLATGYPDAKITSIEGSPPIASLAARNLRSVGCGQVNIVNGSFDEVLPTLLSEGKRFGMVFVDGNHREEPTFNYFNWLADHSDASAILVFDDIHWSKGMTNAWERIKADSRVRMTIDLFFVGIVLFRTEFTVKQHFSIRF